MAQAGSAAWAVVPGASVYELEVSRVRTFDDPRDVFVATLAPTHALLAALDPNTRYYWRVRAGIRPAPDLEPRQGGHAGPMGGHTGPKGGHTGPPLPGTSGRGGPVCPPVPGWI